MTRLEERMDVWLDDDLPAADVGERAWHGVGLARDRGRRLRRRRRLLVAGSTVGGVAVATTVGVLVLGSSTVTTTPEPPSSRSPSPSADVVRPPRPVDSGPRATADRAGRIDVAYPYAGGTLTVTWPAPASGLPWRSAEVESLEPDDAARAVQEQIAKLLDAKADPVTVFGLHGVPTSMLLSFDPNGVATNQVLMLLSRGPLPDDGNTFDRCGAWPSDVPGLGGAAPEHPERCSLVRDLDAQGRELTFVHYVEPAAEGSGPVRSVFTVRPDGLMVKMSYLAPVDLVEPPSWDDIDRVAREVAWPSGPSAQDVVDVRYRVDGADQVVRWPRPASGLPWYVPDPAVGPGDVAGPATPGARDLATALAAAVPGTARDVARGKPPYAALVGRVDGRPTGYLAEVEVPSTNTTWRVQMTRGGVTSTPVSFDLCGQWPAGGMTLGMTSGEQSVWFEDSGWPRRCSITRLGGVTVVNLTVPASKPDGDRPASSVQAHAFTVRADGTAVSANVVAPPQADPGAYLDRLDRLVLELAYPGRA